MKDQCCGPINWNRLRRGTFRLLWLQARLSQRWAWKISSKLLIFTWLRKETVFACQPCLYSRLTAKLSGQHRVLFPFDRPIPHHYNPPSPKIQRTQSLHWLVDGSSWLRYEPICPLAGSESQWYADVACEWTCQSPSLSQSELRPYRAFCDNLFSSSIWSRGNKRGNSCLQSSFGR